MTEKSNAQPRSFSMTGVAAVVTAMLVLPVVLASRAEAKHPDAHAALRANER